MSDYQWDAGDYARSSSAQHTWARELIAKLALRGDERLLDIGCGDGKVTAELARELPRGSVVGIDSSETMVAHARSAQGAGDHGNLEFQQADATALPFDEAFDVVFSNATLHWVLDHRPVLAGIERALRPGGRALLQMGGQGNAAAIVAQLDALAADPGWRAYFQGFPFPYGFYSPADYAEWLQGSRLRIERAELLPKDMVQRSGDGIASWVRTTWLPWTQRIPADRREAFISALVERYLADHPLDADGNAHVAMVRLEVELTKQP